MSTTTEMCFARKGQTKLQIPKENLTESLVDKDLEQRLETVMTVWINQIVNELNWENKENANSSISGIEQEIKFWDKRKSNLASLISQLENKELIKIQEIMKAKKKTQYIENFDKRKADLVIKSKEALEVNNALSCIIALTEEMNKSSIKEIVHLIPKLFQKIWVMWWVSPEH